MRSMRGDGDRHGMRGGTRKKGEGAGNHPSCSQSPHDKAVVARCAQ